MDEQCSIIARPRKRRARRFKPEEVSNEILQQLTLYGVHPVVSYSRPAYIVQVTNPYQQSEILSWSPLHTSNFVIDLLPWSTELEFGQLPWIPGDMEDKSNIIVDPLSILPITSKHRTSLGSNNLRDNFACILDINHDLRGPDFSYMMIDQIKDFCYSKHTAITRCKEIAIQLACLRQQFYPQLNSDAQAVSTIIQFIRNNKQSDQNIYIQEISNGLRDAVNHATIEEATMNEHSRSVQCLPNRLIHLHSFRSLPSLVQVPVSSSFVARLKTIHAIATKQAYGSEAAIITREAAGGGFETYIAARGHTYKYNAVPQQTAATIEAIALYESLRYITNVLGYKILDINYPTLAAMVSSVNKYNTDMISLQSFVSTVTGHTDDMYENFLQLQNLFKVALSTVDNPAQLKPSMNQLIRNVAEHYVAVNNLFDTFMHSKADYLST